MATQPIPVLKETFSDNKEPNGQDFANLIDSFQHKSTKLPQTQILGLNDKLNTLATKEDLASASGGLIPMGDANDMADLDTKPKIHNDSYFVLDQLDENGNPYIFRFDERIGENGDWINTKQVVYKNFLKQEDLLKTRTWLKNKNTAYAKNELKTINCIQNITITPPFAFTENDTFKIAEFYIKDGFGVLNIFKNDEGSIFRNVKLDLTKQRYTDSIIDLFYDFSLEDNPLLNSTTSKVEISHACILTQPQITDEDKNILFAKGWLKNKNTSYSKAEMTAIKRIIDIQLYVTEKNADDVYTVASLRKVADVAQLVIYKNGVSYLTISLDLKSQKFIHNGKISVSYDFFDATDDLNSPNSKIILSEANIIELLPYLRSLNYELTSERTTDQYGNVTTAKIKWSDGSGGNYAVTDWNSDFICYDGYTAYHTDSTKALKQPKVTRNTMGVVIDKPELTLI